MVSYLPGKGFLPWAKHFQLGEWPQVRLRGQTVFSKYGDQSLKNTNIMSHQINEKVRRLVLTDVNLLNFSSTLSLKVSRHKVHTQRDKI